MDLIAKSKTPSFDDLITKNIELNTGSGSFTIEDTKKAERRAIQIFYHKPKNFTTESKILIVVPGAGRNGDSYRDAWIEESEKYGVLVISPKYPENYYAFKDYHLGGLISNPNMRESITYANNSNNVTLDEDKFSFEINTDAKTLLFDDFDRIFELVVEATNSNQTTYDIFGHSAGGQILHRFVLFYPENKANHIIAANSGFYTMPDTSTALPFGIKDTHLNEENLKVSFKNKLVVYLGAQDDENETGGTLLRSATVDKQGLGRLSRGKHFYEFAEELSKNMNTPFNWSINVVPNSGHDHRKMGDAAARFLYENQSTIK
ncbi:hypothetical protein GWK10_00770 [Spongiivirga citrea]|uniref:Alpha/beta hydrolase n=2 Tax=Spongiivirga citrea TaxID=1481457 RepID=A0A6M0CDC7_9FLAO|nr:hypothetical protein [Spongiivirga citrea]